MNSSGTPNFGPVPGSTPAADVASGAVLSLCDVPADAARIAGARRALHRWLGVLPVGDGVAADVVAACYEAMANVVEHAYRDRAGPATLEVAAEFREADRRLTVAVTDRGCWRAVPADVDRGTRGHGLALIRLLSSEAAVDPGPGGTRVTMTWRM